MGKRHVVPANTKASTNWCVRTFNSWLEQRNHQTADNPGSAIPADIIQTHDVDAVSRAMYLFVLEARKADRQCYPSATIRSILCLYIDSCF